MTVNIVIKLHKARHWGPGLDASDKPYVSLIAFLNILAVISWINMTRNLSHLFAIFQRGM